MFVEHAEDVPAVSSSETTVATNDRLGHGRATSIDMALELERQLHSEHGDDEEGPADAAEQPAHANHSEMDATPDPLILANIITNLRVELDEVAAERDSLSEYASDSKIRESELRDALALLTDKTAALEEELTALKLKNIADEETIAVLRSKVEESRRGVMRLQSENKRMSQLSIDSNRANTFFGSNPSSSKRASFMPLTGSRPHRRTASVNDNSFTSDDGDNLLHLEPTGVRSPSLLGREDTSDQDESCVAVKKGRRVSGFFASNRATSSTSRSPPPGRSSTDGEDNAAPERDSVARLRAELEATRRELRDAQDAREASEFCVRTLRTFISEHTSGDNVDFRGSAGVGGAIKLPALPSDIDGDDEAVSPSRPSAKGAGMSGWSIKLWRTDSDKSTTVNTSKISSASESAVVSPSHEAPPGVAASGVNALTQKLGGLFVTRRSFSSVSTTSSQHEAPHSSQQEPILNGSDCSSIDEPEPISPEMSISHNEVLIRDASHSSTDSTESTSTAVEDVPASTEPKHNVITPTSITELAE